MKSFSKFFSDIKLIKEFKNPTGDILSIWFNGKNWFGVFVFSGIRPITERLAIEELNKNLNYTGKEN